jgi:hypothetical protein
MSAKLSLLEIVQEILNDLDSDEVNSIDDTVESAQVAQIVKSTYQAMMSNRNWPHQKRLVTLVPSGNDTLPTHMTMQEEIKELVDIKYNCAKLADGSRRLYKQINWVEPDDFLRISNSRNSTELNIDVIVDGGIELLIRTDQAPRYYTSFNDNTLIFDSYDKEVDDTLQASKMQATAYVMLEWVHLDDAIPDLPAEAFSALIEEAKSKCFVKLKQQSDVTAATEARRQQAWLSRKAWRAAGGVKYPDYGRGSGKSRRDPTFERDR